MRYNNTSAVPGSSPKKMLKQRLSDGESDRPHLAGRRSELG